MVIAMSASNEPPSL